jgi:endonuclease/exonuclease/phosphatase family metal-dependent hydrolase
VHVDPLTTTLRLLEWNLWWRFGPWEERGPAIEATVAALEPDVVCLQEVWEEVDGENQAARLAARLGGDGDPFHHAYTWGMQVSDVRHGNAIVSRWPIRRTAVRFLPAIESIDEQRTALFAELDGPRGPVQVFCTHLNWRFDQSHTRQAQVAELCRFVQEQRPRSFPPILCGDLNADPLSDEVRMLTGRAKGPVPGLVFHDAWDQAGAGVGHTWDNANAHARGDLEPSRRIDYVMVGWPLGERGRGHVTRAELVGVEPVDGVTPSDHYGIVTEIRY